MFWAVLRILFCITLLAIQCYAMIPWPSCLADSNILSPFVDSFLLVQTNNSNQQCLTRAAHMTMPCLQEGVRVYHRQPPNDRCCSDSQNTHTQRRSVMPLRRQRLGKPFDLWPQGRFSRCCIREESPTCTDGVTSWFQENRRRCKQKRIPNGLGHNDL